MANFTPEELERYKEWAESFKGPQMSSIDDVLEAQREAQAAAEIASRGERAASRSLGTLGEAAKGIEGMKAAPSISPAQASAKVFEEAGSALPKNIAEDIVEGASKGGKNARREAARAALSQVKEPPAKYAVQSAQVFEEAGSALPRNVSHDIATVTGQSRLAKNAAESAKVFEEAGSSLLKNIAEAGTSAPKVSTLGKLAKYLPAVGLGIAGYEASEGDLVGAGLTGLETLLGGAAPRLAAPLELLRPTPTVSEEEEQMESNRLKRSNILANLQKRGLAEESVGNDTQLASKKPQQFDYNVPERPTPLLPTNKTETSIPEIKSVKEQKSSPTSKSSVSTGVGEDDSPEAKLNEAIKTESEKAKKPEMDFNEMLRMAQEARDKGVLLGNIGKAAETFATGLTGTVKGGVVTKPVGTDFYDKLIKQAEQPVEDVGTAYTMKTKQDEMQRLARRRDSNSDESKFARDLLAQQGIKVPEAATAEALEKYAPQLTNILNQREAREARAASARERALDREALKQSKLDEKQMDFAFKASEKIRGDKYFKEFNDLKINRDLVVDAINNPSPQKDNVIIYNFIKALDPGSAVKEGEIKFTQAARSWPLKIKTTFNKAYKGDILDPKERKEILDFMNQRVDFTRKAFATSSSGLLNQLKDKKIDLKYIPGMEEISSELETKRADVQEYANDHFKGDYNKAYKYLKDEGEL